MKLNRRGGAATTRRALAFWTVAGLLLVTWAQSVSGQTGDSPATFSRSPAEGVAGITVSVSGTGCLLDGRPAQFNHLLFDRTDGGIEGAFHTSVDVPVQPDGTWSGQLRVPPDAPAGSYNLTSTCQASDMVWGSVNSDFRVLAGPPITVPTTTTTLPTTTTTLVPAGPPLRAPLDRTG